MPVTRAFGLHRAHAVAAYNFPTDDLEMVFHAIMLHCNASRR